jgi:hypothetical protein
MGKEANCVCEWSRPAGRVEAARVKAVLEPPELILRGEIKRRIPFATIKQIAVQGARLRFRVEGEDHAGRDFSGEDLSGESFSLELGEAQAAKWALALLKPPPTLAGKLGIVPGCAVRVLGTVDDEALRSALEGARADKGKGTRGDVGVIIARVNTPAQIADAWKKAAAQVAGGAALWMVYPKGRGHAIDETAVREAGLAAGFPHCHFVDVKVAAVSATLTGLKFVRRKILKSK